MEEKKFKSKIDMVLFFLKGSKRYFIGAVMFACLVSLLDMMNPKIISYTVDTVLGDQVTTLPLIIQLPLNAIGGVEWLTSHLWVIAFVVIFVACIGALCRFLFNMLNSLGAETLVYTMRKELFQHILFLPQSWHSQNHTGDIIQRCTSDVEQIKIFLSEQLTLLFRFLILICMAIYFMLGIHVGLTLVAGAFIPIIIGYSLFFHKGIGESFEKADIEEGRLSSIAQENLTGVRVVRAFGRERNEREKFEKQNDYYTSLWIHLIRLLSAFWSISDMLSYLQILCVLAYGTILCVNGDISVGNLIAFHSYAAMLMWPIRTLGRVIANLSKAGISIERLMYIMNAKEESDKEDAIDIDMHQDICFEHVSFQYENSSSKVLDDITLTIKAGTTVGILGGTGSGKSTLVSLLNRLYPLSSEQGTITIGGVNIQNIKKESLRKNIGMVLQEPYLFSKTLEENLAISCDDINREDIQYVTRIACLEDTIHHFKQGYQTFVGERGVTLSGGQKQRTAIAQTLISKPPILIFDDSLSAVDAKTDAYIRKALKNHVGESTVILIAQRMTTLMDADMIIVMDQGRIVQQGTHEELVQQEGIYKHIYDLQSRTVSEVQNEA